jgi:predicted aldo/keto reductase-like oxidoreductase
MKTRRKEVSLATKVPARDGDKAQAIIEGSLKRLQTSQLDLIHIHMLMGEDDLANIEAKDGVLIRCSICATSR